MSSEQDASRASAQPVASRKRSPSCFRCCSIRSPFFIAVEEGDAAEVARFLNEDALWLKAYDKKGKRTAWHLAAEKGHVEVLRVLSERTRQEDVGALWSGHHLPLSSRLMTMAGSRDPLGPDERVCELVNGRNGVGVGTLTLAAFRDHVEVVKYLLEIGADPWQGDFDGRNAAHYAAKAGAIRALLVLLETDRPLTSRACNHNHAGTRYVDSLDSFGFTPLHYATWANRRSAMMLLIGFDANIIARSLMLHSDYYNLPAGSTPLHVACLLGDLDRVKLLLRAYYETAADLLPSQTALLASSERRRRARSHPDPRLILTRTQRLPFHVAARCGHRHLLDWLDPSVPLMFLFGGEDDVGPEGPDGPRGSGSVALVGVSRLTVIAAKALHQALLDSIDAAAEDIRRHQAAQEARNEARRKRREERRTAREAAEAAQSLKQGKEPPLEGLRGTLRRLMVRASLDKGGAGTGAGGGDRGGGRSGGGRKGQDGGGSGGTGWRPWRSRGHKGRRRNVTPGAEDGAVPGGEEQPQPQPSPSTGVLRSPRRRHRTGTGVAAAAAPAVRGSARAATAAAAAAGGGGGGCSSDSDLSSTDRIADGGGDAANRRRSRGQVAAPPPPPTTLSPISSLRRTAPGESGATGSGGGDGQQPVLQAQPQQQQQQQQRTSQTNVGGEGGGSGGTDVSLDGGAMRSMLQRLYPTSLLRRVSGSFSGSGNVRSAASAAEEAALMGRLNLAGITIPLGPDEAVALYNPPRYNMPTQIVLPGSRTADGAAASATAGTSPTARSAVAAAALASGALGSSSVAGDDTVPYPGQGQEQGTGPSSCASAPSTHGSAERIRGLAESGENGERGGGGEAATATAAAAAAEGPSGGGSSGGGGDTSTTLLTQLCGEGSISDVDSCEPETPTTHGRRPLEAASFAIATSANIGRGSPAVPADTKRTNGGVTTTIATRAATPAAASGGSPVGQHRGAKPEPQAEQQLPGSGTGTAGAHRGGTGAGGSDWCKVEAAAADPRVMRSMGSTSLSQIPAEQRVSLSLPGATSLPCEVPQPCGPGPLFPAATGGAASPSAAVPVTATAASGGVAAVAAEADGVAAASRQSSGGVLLDSLPQLGDQQDAAAATMGDREGALVRTAEDSGGGGGVGAVAAAADGEPGWALGRVGAGARMLLNSLRSTLKRSSPANQAQVHPIAPDSPPGRRTSSPGRGHRRHRRLVPLPVDRCSEAVSLSADGRGGAAAAAAGTADTGDGDGSGSLPAATSSSLPASPNPSHHRSPAHLHGQFPHLHVVAPRGVRVASAHRHHHTRVSLLGRFNAAEGGASYPTALSDSGATASTASARRRRRTGPTRRSGVCSGPGSAAAAAAGVRQGGDWRVTGGQGVGEENKDADDYEDEEGEDAEGTGTTTPGNRGGGGGEGGDGRQGQAAPCGDGGKGPRVPQDATGGAGQLRSSFSSSASGAGATEGGGADGGGGGTAEGGAGGSEEDVCPVCLDEAPNLLIQVCRHQICMDCARDLVKRHGLTPALCPYCRGIISGFKARVAAEAAARR